MFKIGRRILCALLVAVMLVGSLFSCGIVSGDAVMEYKGYEISEAMYSYWMARYKTLFITTYGNKWDSRVDDTQTYAEFFHEFVMNYAKKVLVCMYLFDSLELEFDEKTIVAVEDRILGLEQAHGGKEKLNKVLQEYGLNIDTLEDIYYQQEKVNFVTSHLFGSGGTMAVTDNDRISYYEANYYCYDRIYLYTEKCPKLTDKGDYITDAEGNYQMRELTEAEKAEKERELETIKSAIENGTKSFLALRAEYSDENLSVFDFYPDGINVSANDAGSSYNTEFIKTLQQTEVGAYAVCDDGVGCGKYVILRRPLKSFTELTAQEINMMKNFEKYVYDHKADTYFATMEIKVNEDVAARYDVKQIKQLKYMNI